MTHTADQSVLRAIFEGDNYLPGIVAQPYYPQTISLHKFTSWDSIDEWLRGIYSTLPDTRHEITQWRFLDSCYWHGELVDIPSQAMICVMSEALK